jgi:hypothetical protein
MVWQRPGSRQAGILVDGNAFIRLILRWDLDSSVVKVALEDLGHSSL